MAFNRGGREEKEAAASLGSPSFGAPSTPSPTRLGGSGNSDALLGKGTKINGTLSFAGPVEIDAEIEGEIIAKDRLTIGEAANIRAKITGVDVIIRGQVTGDVIASKTLSLRRPAKVLGNISAPTLSIEEGVVFDGKCSMNHTNATQSSNFGVKSISSEGSSSAERNNAERATA